MENMEKILNKINEFTGGDVRFILLLLLLFFLPSFEALKNISAFLFVLSWVILAKKNSDWGGRWTVIDTILLLWILADLIISVNAIISYQLSGASFRDVIRFVLIAWVLSRTNFTNKRIVNLSIVAVVTVSIAILYNHYSVLNGKIELYSVGHINHTAIFLLISYSISLALLLFNFNNLNNYQKVTLVFTSIVLFLTTINTGSRATFGLIIIISLFDFLYLLIRVRKLSLILGFLGIFTILAISFSQNPPIALKRIMAQDSLIDDGIREKIREFSYYAFKQNPLLGVGFSNFNKIKL